MPYRFFVAYVMAMYDWICERNAANEAELAQIQRAEALAQQRIQRAAARMFERIGSAFLDAIPVERNAAPEVRRCSCGDVPQGTCAQWGCAAARHDASFNDFVQTATNFVQGCAASRIVDPNNLRPGKG